MHKCWTEVSKYSLKPLARHYWSSQLGMSEFCAHIILCRIGHRAKNLQSSTEILKFSRFCSAILLLV